MAEFSFFSCCVRPAKDLTSEIENTVDTLEFLKNVKLFKRLPEDVLPNIVTCCREVQFESLQRIVVQGHEGHEFFVIKCGNAIVEIDGDEVAILNPGDYFGENALLFNEPRKATVTAKTPLTALKIDRDSFKSMGLHERLEFKKRGAVGGGGNKRIVVKSPTPKTPAERELIEKALRSNANLKTMVEMNDEQVKAMTDIAWKETVALGDEVIRQGNLDADYFYVVQTGCFQIFVSGQNNKSAESAAAEMVSTVMSGGSFGELALLYFAPRAATVKATQDSTVWVIDRKTFKENLFKKSKGTLEKHVSWLKQVQKFNALDDAVFQKLAGALVETTFCRDDIVVQAHEKCDSLYLFFDGTLTVDDRAKGPLSFSATESTIQMIGEKAFFDREANQSTVKVQSATARAASIDRAACEVILQGDDVRCLGVQSVQARELGAEPIRREKIYFKDLKKLCLLGCGGFAKVDLVEHKGSGELYALKSISKGYLVRSGMEKAALEEKKIQMMCNSPFIIKLYDTFNATEYLHFCIEVAFGGDLHELYNKKEWYGKQNFAKFYTASVILAFDHMHSMKIIYRDLKPENLLISQDGNLKVTDFGLAKISPGKTYTTCGTPDFFAPELITQTGHTMAVDWWTLGILIFEFLTGRTPFQANSPMMIYKEVIKGIERVPFPKTIKGPSEELVKALCKKDPNERLPMKRGGIENIKKCTWFSDFEWEDIRVQTMKPPYVPQVKLKEEIVKKAPRMDPPPFISYVAEANGWDDGFATST